MNCAVRWEVLLLAGVSPLLSVLVAVGGILTDHHRLRVPVTPAYTVMFQVVSIGASACSLPVVYRSSMTYLQKPHLSELLLRYAGPRAVGLYGEEKYTGLKKAIRRVTNVMHWRFVCTE